MNIKEVEPYSQYIGDGIYLVDKAYHDGYHYWLITTDGIDIQNKIALDFEAVIALVKALHGKMIRDSEHLSHRL